MNGEITIEDFNKYYNKIFDPAREYPKDFCNLEAACYGGKPEDQASYIGAREGFLHIIVQNVVPQNVLEKAYLESIKNRNLQYE